MESKRRKLLSHQKDAISRLRTGSILLGGVGSGKTLTSLAYFYSKVCGGSLGSDYIELTNITTPKDLYVITTARKRDSLDWKREAAFFAISSNRESSVGNVQLVVDSWNMIDKYKDVKDAYFIFDEQRVVGSGAWSKAFLKITKANGWILLTATPGDTWMDYISVFVANGFYKNRTEFIREHVIYNTFASFPKIEGYMNIPKLNLLKKKVLVAMKFKAKIERHNIDIVVPHNKELLKKVVKDKWNVFKEQPIKQAGEACYAMRRVVNSDPSRLDAIKDLSEKHNRIIVFYNFDYELEILRTLSDVVDYPVAEYNGHLHEDIPKSNKWIYLVQYVAGAEAWNCVETNVVVFYSLNYSYKTTTQAAGRIDRMNTPFGNLYYYYIRSEAFIDIGIVGALKEKTNFNEEEFLRDNKIYF